MKRWREVFSFAVVAAWLAGCGASASLHTLQPVEERLSRYDKAVVTVAIAPEAAWREGARFAADRVKFSLVEKLRAAKKFREVADQEGRAADADLKIALTLASLAAGYSGGWSPSIGIGVGGGSSSGAAGIGIGGYPYSGSSGGMIVQAELLDAKSGRRVGYFDATATSGDVPAQAEAIAEKLAAAIAQN